MALQALAMASVHSRYTTFQHVDVDPSHVASLAGDVSVHKNTFYPHLDADREHLHFRAHDL
eukprot:8568144-Pyramimonas_sp.AAC.1